MALQEKLDRFKKQQEKCQSTLTSIAASNKATSHKFTPVAAAPSVARAPAPAVKFSNDTERLQHINSIRKSPVGAQIKRVINLLLETRLAYTPEQINEACYVDINSNKAVFDSLRNNLKVHYDGKRFSYKIFKVDDDLKLLFRGIELPRDMLDIEKDLQKNGMKPATNTAQRRARSEVQGLSSKSKPKKKKHEITKRTKLTNAHLPELFRNLNDNKS
ncbi:transcription initiation factor IIE subunit beta-like [Fagus crenata]